MMDIHEWLDFEREEYEITKVSQDGQAGDFTITLDDGMSFWVQAKYACIPKVGDKAVMWGRGIGYAVRGLAIAGRVLYYRTGEEQRAQEQQEVDERHAQKLADYESKRREYDQRV